MQINKKIKNMEGITLIALVITIIVLLILAGVSIAMLTGDNGILAQAQKAKNETENAQLEEENVLTSYEQIINTSIGVTLETITGNETNNTVTQDNLGNRVVVPAGFRVVNPEDNVEDGIIIEDVTHEATKGSQFVWIPVGKNIKKKDETTFDVKLGRYIYKEDGTVDANLSKTEPTEQLKVTLDSLTCFIEELENNATTNVSAKDIEDFIDKVSKTGGYYIGRYEARTSVERTKSTEDSELTQITVRENEYVYNYITQSQAANLSRNIYINTNFKSDLMNSYAWDTAIDFLQKCDDRTENNSIPYSRQTSLNVEILAKKGTEDVICNIYDMASNCYEWTTERAVYEEQNELTYTLRGGIYAVNTYYCADRHGGSNSYSDIRSFFPPNPILIIKKLLFE